MVTRSPVARLEIMYSPGHNSASSCTRALASSRLFASSTKCRVPSVRNLKTEKGRRQMELRIKAYREGCSVVYIEKVSMGPTKVAVEFTRPATSFWRIAYPPADWTASTYSRSSRAQQGDRE